MSNETKPINDMLRLLATAIAVAAALITLQSCRTNPGMPQVAIQPVCSVTVVGDLVRSIGEDQQPFTAITQRQAATDTMGRWTDTFGGFQPTTGRTGPGLITTSNWGGPDTWALNEVSSTGIGPKHIVRSASGPAPTVGRIPPGTNGIWIAYVQNGAGVWATLQGRGRAAMLSEIEDPNPITGQPMAIGVASPRLFMCAGGRSEDDIKRTTILHEIDVEGNVILPVQDLLFGDDRFVPASSSGPLGRPRMARPAPMIAGLSPLPSPPIFQPEWQGSAQCAMSEVNDDPSTRVLYLLAVYQGVVYVARFWDWGVVVQDGQTFSRFRQRADWQSLNAPTNPDNAAVGRAAIIRSGSGVQIYYPTRSEIINVALSSSGVFSSSRAVTQLNGDQAAGLPFTQLSGAQLGAGRCPSVDATRWDGEEGDIVVAMIIGGPVRTFRHASSPRLWDAARPASVFSPLTTIPNGAFDTNSFSLISVGVAGRYFPEAARP